ncbi:50S ribosomal protein L20 [Microgenomates group bacterium RBG_16_45_19]|nr:MAG: 50S ribosomal protein L20 [Microgenomates group bacterium RBG_16_45_19]
MRVKASVVTRQRHKKVLNAAKGSRLSRSRHFKAAQEQVLHAGQYAYIGRRLRKRDFRRLWIQRINAGLSQIDDGPSYSVLMNLLTKANVKLNRKMLAEIALNDPATFKTIVSQVYGK